ncbi:50S ribosomal protein L20 [Candidatus Parcubacteria bacterium]|nr:MAG: 50S ribosomal protein L20 [Candidatus Parcubacteria bacterium]
MPRVKRGVVAHKRREKLLRYTKGFRWGRKSKSRFAKEALLHAWSRAFRGRKEKKRVFRKLWSVRINAAARAEGLTYGKLIAALRRRNIRINRKILADLAAEHPAVFKKIVEAAR